MHTLTLTTRQLQLVSDAVSGAIEEYDYTEIRDLEGEALELLEVRVLILRAGTPAEQQEPTRLQLAAVDLLARKYGSMEVSLPHPNGDVVATAANGGEWVINADGYRVQTKATRCTSAR
jgi:hypothetical protein